MVCPNNKSIRSAVVSSLRFERNAVILDIWHFVHLGLVSEYNQVQQGIEIITNTIDDKLNDPEIIPKVHVMMN